MEIINRLQGYLRLYTNHFQPVMKMIEKTRVGSRVKKKYDRPRTPYQRVLDSSHVEEGRKEAGLNGDLGNRIDRGHRLQNIACHGGDLWHGRRCYLWKKEPGLFWK